MVREYTLEQRRFLVKRRLAGATLAVIQEEYAMKKKARKCLRAMCDTFEDRRV